MKRSEWLFLVALLAALALVPLLASNLVINFLVTALIVALAALGAGGAGRSPSAMPPSSALALT